MTRVCLHRLLHQGSCPEPTRKTCLLRTEPVSRVKDKKPREKWSHPWEISCQVFQCRLLVLDLINNLKILEFGNIVSLELVRKEVEMIRL